MDSTSTDTRNSSLPQWLYPLLVLAATGLLLLLPRGWASLGLLAVAGASVVYAVGQGVRHWRGYMARRVPWHPYLRLAWLGCTIAAAVALHPAFGEEMWFIAALLLLVATISAAPMIPQNAPEHFPTPLPTPMKPFHWGALVLGVIGLLVVALRGTMWGEQTLGWFSVHAQYAVLWLGVGGVVLGLSALGYIPRPRPNRLFYALLAVMAVALGVRLFVLATHLTYMPDEWIFAAAIHRFHAGAPLTRIVDNYAASTWIFIYWQHFLSAWVGGGVFGLRFTSALIGALTVGAVGWLAYELFDKRSSAYPAPVSHGVVCAVVLAFFPAHIHYSRLALYNIVDPLFGVAAAAFLARGFRTGNRLAFVLGGAVLGLSQYFYEAGKLMFVPLFVLWLAGVLLARRGHGLRGVLLAGATALMVGVVPWFPNFFDSANATIRLQTGSIVGDGTDPHLDIWQRYLGNIPESALMLTTTPDSFSAPYFGGEQGLVPVWWLPLFLLGATVVLASPLRPQHLLLWLWVGGALAGVSLLRSQTTPRYVILLPVLVMVCVLGLNAALAQINKARRWQKRVLLAGLTGAFCLWGVAHYFVIHIPELNDMRNAYAARTGNYDLEDLAFRVSDVPAGRLVIIISEKPMLTLNNVLFQEFIGYFNPAVSVRQFVLDDELKANIWLLEDTTRITFFVTPASADILNILDEFYQLSGPSYTPNPDVREFALVRFDVVGIRGETN